MSLTREEKNARRRERKRKFKELHKEEYEAKIKKKNNRRRERARIFRELHKDEYEAKKIQRNIKDRQKRDKISKEHPRSYKIVSFSRSVRVVIPYRIAKELNINKDDRVYITTDGVRILIYKVYRTNLI